jgi:hypothetical protein
MGTSDLHNEMRLRERALARLQGRRDFRVHLAAYLAINTILILIWALGGGGLFWPIFPILGWGIGVAFNAWDVYWRSSIGEDEIRRETERLRRPMAS